MLDRYHEYLQRRLPDKRKLRAYWYPVRRFDDWLTETGRDLTTDTKILKDYAEVLAQRESPIGVAMIVNILRRRLLDEFLVGVCRVRVAEQEPPDLALHARRYHPAPANSEDVARFEAAALKFSPRSLGLLAAMLAHTGLVPKELATLKVRDFVGETLRVGDRTILLTPRGRGLLVAYLADARPSSDDLLFPHHRQPPHPVYLQRVIYTILKTAGLSPRLSYGSLVRFYQPPAVKQALPVSEKELPDAVGLGQSDPV